MGSDGDFGAIAGCDWRAEAANGGREINRDSEEYL